MPNYTVKKGDWLQKIAEQNGLKSWTEIYNAPENAAFKKSHPNPNLIYPGDVVFVPDPPKKPEPVKVEPPKKEPVKADPPKQDPPKKDPPKKNPPKAKPAPAKPKIVNTREFDHQGGFRFVVEIGGVQAGAFRAVDGLSVTVETIEYQGGGDKYARQIPGRPKVAPVVLKKGYVNSATLWDWMKGTMEGEFKAQNVSVILLDDSGQTELARFNLFETWPTRWSGWQLDANGSNAMVEEMELQVRHMERVNG